MRYYRESETHTVIAVAIYTAFCISSISALLGSCWGYDKGYKVGQERGYTQADNKYKSVLINWAKDDAAWELLRHQLKEEEQQ